MIKRYSVKITESLILNKQIDLLEQETYEYAFEILIAFIINIFFILIIGFIINKLIYTLLFLCFYCPIRQFAGGYHADNYKKCLVVFISMYLVNILTVDILIHLDMTNIISLITFISYIGIWKLAPIEHRHNPLTFIEKKQYRNKVRCLISLILIFSLIGIKVQSIYLYSLYLSTVIICIFIMLLLANIKEKEGKEA